MLTAMKIGIRLESLGLPLRKGLDQAVRMGAAGVQIDAIGDLLPDRLSQTGRREFVNLLRSLNLELAALNCFLRRGLDVAEDLAFSLCRDNAMPIIVFELADGNILRVVRGEKIGTLVSYSG